MRGIAYRIKFVTKTLCNTAFQVRRNSFVCDKESSRRHAGLAKAAPPSGAIGVILSRKGNMHTYLRGGGGGHNTRSFAASSTSCTDFTSSMRRNLRTEKTANFSRSQISVALYLQPTVRCVCITTIAPRERLAQPLYRKRRKKGRGRSSSQASTPPTAKLVADEKLPAEDKLVVVVESPAKAKTIEKYLGGNRVVLPSFGHVRDLASRAGSVRPDEDFKMVWEVPSSARQHLNAIKDAVKGAGNLFLASDPDREGEAIAWHVLEMLKMEGALHTKLIVKRVVFNEITKTAVVRAMEAPRDISWTLVNAYLARRALDYLIGFDLSPLLWRKLPGSRSAGRVQSAALRIVCERESEMEAFVPREYWTVDTIISGSEEDKNSSKFDGSSRGQSHFPAKVTYVDGEKLSQFSLASDKQAQAVAQRVEASRFSVSSVKKSRVRRNPPAPYITSTLQQDASSKLAFGASRTMALAQQLYEGVSLDNDELTGLITYMRTDGVQISAEATQTIRSLVAERYGIEYMPMQRRQFVSKVKNAQEAHEAIRPTDINRLPSMLSSILEDDALRLYSMIWCRTVACQMEQAVLSQVAVDMTNDAEDLQMRATGSSVSFPGFLAGLKDKAALAVRREDSDDGGDDFVVEEERLPSLEAGDVLFVNSVRSNQHFTEAPPRYSEGSLVRKLEEMGIGRPSTYASTLRTLQTRKYVRIEKRRMFPESRGRMVTAFLLHYFPKFSDYKFTAKLETQLDDVSAGRTEWKTVLTDFWPEFHERVSGVLQTPIEQVVKLLEDVFADQLFPSSGEKVCPSCHEGVMGLKLSRFGAGYFLGCSRYPTCMYKTDVLHMDGADSSDGEESIPQPQLFNVRTVGVDPGTGLEVLLKNGPYGKYVESGIVSKQQKPKRIPIPKDMNDNEMTLHTALELLKYPYELGKHPDTNAPILVNSGRYGPFIRCKGVFVSVLKESVETLTVEQAAALLRSKNASRRGRKGKADAEVKPTNPPKCNKAKSPPSTTANKKKAGASSGGTKEPGKKRARKPKDKEKSKQNGGAHEKELEAGGVKKVQSKQGLSSNTPLVEVTTS